MFICHSLLTASRLDGVVCTLTTIKCICRRLFSINFLCLRGHDSHFAGAFHMETDKGVLKPWPDNKPGPEHITLPG